MNKSSVSLLQRCLLYAFSPKKAYGNLSPLKDKAMKTSIKLANAVIILGMSWLLVLIAIAAGFIPFPIF